MNTALDNAFPDHLDEIIEGVLRRYRPIFSDTMTACLREDLKTHLENNLRLFPWHLEGQTDWGGGIGSLTAGQVALLGGSRPLRLLQGLAGELEIPLDGGDKRTMHEAEQMLSHSADALESLAEHHVVTPVEGRAARVEKLREFAELGVATQIAGLMAGLYEDNRWSGRPVPEDPRALVKRYFLKTVEVFARIELSRADQEVFRDYYVHAIDIHELAAERGRGLAREIARRKGFLERLAAALAAEIDLVTAAPPRHDPVAPEALGEAGHPQPPPKALSRAAGAVARPRKR